MQRSVESPSRASIVVIVAIAVAALYAGREILVPIALAVLFSFLLGPLVTRLQRIVGRIPAVLGAVFLAFIVLGTVGFFVGRELTDVAANLPAYRANIEHKALAVRGVFGRVVDGLHEILTDLSGPRPASPAVAGGPAAPVPVQAVEPSPTPFQFIQFLLGPLLGPLETAGIVIIFVIFMLIEREAVRDRLLRLVGHHDINLSTQALNDASRRISGYLLIQLIVNGTYGIGIGIGLYLLGVPNGLIWGALAAFMRFIPYVGTWMAATVPLTLSIATTQNWQPLYVFLLFFGLDLIVPTFIEPVLYGAHTGVSPLALLVSALFWTFLWGLPGLFLSMPLTVCMMVLGRYVPQLKFLEILLTGNQVLHPRERLYQRLVAMDRDEAAKVLEDELQCQSLIEVYDSILFPVLAMAGSDHQRGSLDNRRDIFVRKAIMELTEDLIERAPRPEAAAGEGMAEKHGGVIVFLPARHRDDLVAGALAAQYLRVQRIPAESISVLRLRSGSAQPLDSASVVCISALAPSALSHARLVYNRLCAQYPDKSYIICLWASKLARDEACKRIRFRPGDSMVTSLKELSEHLSAVTNAAAQSSVEKSAGAR